MTHPTHVLINIYGMLIIIFICLLIGAKYFISGKLKGSTALWHMVILTSLFIYAGFHIFLDRDFLSGQHIEIVEYWVTHIFIIVPAIISTYLLRDRALNK